MTWAILNWKQRVRGGMVQRLVVVEYLRRNEQGVERNIIG